jgi:2-haloacid dehalogenase
MSDRSGYRLLFLDADDTLFDFSACEKNALSSALAAGGIHLDEGLLADYKAINKRLWAEVEAGTASQAEIKYRRFAELSLRRSLDLDCRTLGDAYVEALSSEGVLMDGAAEVCRALAATRTLVLVTNGIAYVQRRRFEASEIRQCFARLVISEEVGFAKPDPRILEAAAAGLDPVSKTEMLMVGDSPSSDICAGRNYGIDTCLYKPDGLPVGVVMPTYQIRSLRELLPIAAAGRVL